jgi:hypothetical protein
MAREQAQQRKRNQRLEQKLRTEVQAESFLAIDEILFEECMSDVKEHKKKRKP